MYDDELEAIKVHAIVEDALVEDATRDEPETYRPGLCEAIIMVDKADWPKREVDQLNWLDDIDPEWTLINDGGW
jgi:hypothetical protein